MLTGIAPVRLGAGACAFPADNIEFQRMKRGVRLPKMLGFRVSRETLRRIERVQRRDELLTETLRRLVETGLVVAEAPTPEKAHDQESGIASR